MSYTLACIEIHSDGGSSNLFQGYRFGAGGHARVLIEILQAMGAVEITGLLDVDPKLWKTRQLGIIVVGS